MGHRACRAGHEDEHFSANGSDRRYRGLAIRGPGNSRAWQFAGLASETLAAMRLSAWGSAVSFGVIAYLSQLYFFNIPIVFSGAIFLCLGAAAWLSGRRR
jgi:hypothetical protein